MALSGRGTGRHPAPWETKECWPSFSDKQLLPEEAISPLCSSILLLLRPVCAFVRVCVSPWNGATVEGVRYGSSSHSLSLVDVCLHHSVFSVSIPVLAGLLKTCSTTSPSHPLLLWPSLSSSLGVNGGNRAAIKMHI